MNYNFYVFFMVGQLIRHWAYVFVCLVFLEALSNKHVYIFLSSVQNSAWRWRIRSVHSLSIELSDVLIAFNMRLEDERKKIIAYFLYLYFPFVCQQLEWCQGFNLLLSNYFMSCLSGSGYLKPLSTVHLSTWVVQSTAWHGQKAIMCVWVVVYGLKVKGS